MAPVTVDNNDFVFANVCAPARATSDREVAARVAEAYVPYMEGVFAHLSGSPENYWIRGQADPLIARQRAERGLFGDLIRMPRGRGYRFISLGAALDDPAYTLPDAQTPRGLSCLSH